MEVECVLCWFKIMGSFFEHKHGVAQLVSYEPCFFILSRPFLFLPFSGTTYYMLSTVFIYFS